MSAARAVEALLKYLRDDGNLDGVRALHQAAVAAGNHAAPQDAETGHLPPALMSNVDQGLRRVLGP